MNPSRRKFIKTSTRIAAATGMAAMIPVKLSCSNANDQFIIGSIGLRNQGFANLRGFLEQPNVICGALCDIDTRILDARASQIEEEYGQKPVHYRDYREVLDRKDIDAVIISTPDHWHCLMMVDALDAGKHVFVEKPLANSIEECRIMEDAAKRSRKVVTVGQWQRSGPHWQDAVNFIRSGDLGKISRVKAWAYTSKDILPVAPDEDPPAEVDYDLWLGPARERPFNKNRFHYNFRYFWDYAGGLMTDWGVHMLDYALYGMDVPEPVSAVAAGGKFSYPEGARETPDTLQILYEFEDFVISWEHSVCLGNGPEKRGHGVMFQGNNGTLFVDRGGWQVFPERISDEEFKMEEVPFQTGPMGFYEHIQNFIESIKTRKEPNCPVKVAGDVARFAHMGNLAYRTGEKLYWDKETKSFINNDAANRLVKPVYREPYKLPEI
ncbi:MAG: Gfo/Idh/MocA family oxidoreductase [Bacteroidales bacterium]|nr:MAG: Gfo/Idh/MocA family oxidoreductase [Bacteroidales bacterium]